MPMYSFANRIANTGFRLLVAPRTAQQKDAIHSQQQTLADLLARAAATQIGTDYDFGSLHNHQSYQQRMPVLSYETLWQQYFQADFPCIQGRTWPEHTSYFALSSGTSSGTTKYLPLPPSMLRSNRRTALDVMAWHQRTHADFLPFNGSILYLGGATRLTSLGKGIQAGDLSAIASLLRPSWVNRWFAPPFAISNISDWQERYRALLDYLAQPRDIQTISGVPMWIHKLLVDVRKQGLPGLDRLKLVVHGGTTIDPYLESLRALLPKHCARREVYPASEGFIAYDDSQAKDWHAPRPLRLNTGNGLFFEFVPANEQTHEHPRRYWLGNADTGQDYALLLTTNAGLFSYPLGDLVRITSKNPPRIVFAGRTAWYISHFGEHLHYADIASAVEQLAASGAPGITEWCFGIVLRQRKGQHCGRHHLIVESPQPLPQHANRLVDQALCQANADYSHLRHTPFLPDPPLVCQVKPGAFDALLEQLGKGGGQSKVAKVIHQPERFMQMYNILRSYRSNHSDN